jgi:hypothetical protein
MRVLVWQQVGAGSIDLVVERVAFDRAIVARFVMFDAFVTDRIAQGEQKMIVAIVLAAVQGRRFLHQMLHARKIFRIDLERGRTIGRDVEFLIPAERKRLFVRARNDRRIDDRVQRGGRERDRIAALRRDGQRRAERPAVRQRDACIDRRTLGGCACRIHREIAVFEDRQLRGAQRMDLTIFRVRSDHVEVHLERLRARRNDRVNGVHVDEIAPPVERRAARRDVHVHDVFDRSDRAVVARDPLRIHERERSCRSRHRHLDVKDLLRRVGRVDCDAQRRRTLRGRR